MRRQKMRLHHTTLIVLILILFASTNIIQIKPVSAADPVVDDFDYSDLDDTDNMYAQSRDYQFVADCSDGDGAIVDISTVDCQFYTHTERFSTYTSAGPNASKFDATSTRLTYTDLLQHDKAYIYRDFGVGYFTTFTHDFDFCMTEETVDYEFYGFVPYMLSDQLGCKGDWGIGVGKLPNNLTYVFPLFNYSPYDTYQMICGQVNVTDVYSTGRGDTTSYNFTVGIIYYWRIVRDGTNVQYLAYSNSARTAGYLLSNVTHQELLPSCGYRYAMASSQNETVLAYTTSGFVENMDLEQNNEVVTFRYQHWDAPAYLVYSGETDEWELNVSACSVSFNGNDCSVTFAVRPLFNSMELNMDTFITVEDNSTTTDVQGYDTNIDVVSDLVVSGFACDDDRGDISQTIVFTGTVYYVNDPYSSTATTFYPADAEFTTIHVYDDWNNDEGNDSTIVNGAFSVSFTANSTVGLETYNPYINMADSEYTDAEESPTDTYIADNLAVSFSVDNNVPYVGQTITFTVGLTRDYDSSSVSNYNYSVVRNNTSFETDCTTSTFTDMVFSVSVYVYNFSEVTDNTYAVTSFTDPSDLTVSWLSSGGGGGGGGGIPTTTTPPTEPTPPPDDTDDALPDEEEWWEQLPDIFEWFEDLPPEQAQMIAIALIGLVTIVSILVVSMISDTAKKRSFTKSYRR